MARRSVLRRRTGSRDDLASVKMPSPEAMLWVIRVLVDEADVPVASEGISRIAERQRTGRTIGMIWCIVVSFIWGATTLGTLVIAKAAELRTTATVTVIALELAGFCAGLVAALWVRRRDTS
jgi:hypothetical protein